MIKCTKYMLLTRGKNPDSVQFFYRNMKFGWNVQDKIANRNVVGKICKIILFQKIFFEEKKNTNDFGKEN